MRIAELDGVRGAAIVAVFLCHALKAPLLWAGVDVFFVLSGFLITGILMRNKGKPAHRFFGDFYWRRAVRILPSYCLLLAITTAVFGAAWMANWQYFAFFAANIPIAFGREAYLSPLWSLAVEEQFYLLWPVAVFFLPLRWLIRIPIMALVAIPVLRALATPLFATANPIYYLTPFRADALFAGAILAMAWRASPGAVRRLYRYAMVCMAAMFALLVAVSGMPAFRHEANSATRNTWIYAITLVAAVSIIIVALSGEGFLCRLLRANWLRYIGRISYAMYLIHETLIVIAHQFVPNRGVAALLAFGATVSYATGTWYGFEKALLGYRGGVGSRGFSTLSGAIAGRVRGLVTAPFRGNASERVTPL